MYLKNLHIIGFKSFADKTNVDFLPGVTAIVGPNGCGKSNVSDAIRWVLGEQSAKALRGGEMADVIFSGTDARKPFGMAEVSLTFADCKDVLKTGALAGSDVNFDEVTITRRIFRDGNSEYLINKSPCRLKDVHTIFMDTGIGRSSYSIMEQGKIDKILSSHPEDRRAVFEEAAGITKFKSQKKEALRKLEYTEANLVRVQDIIREVKRQIGSLQRQVGKARRFQALSAEVKHLETQLGRYEHEKIQAEIEGVERESLELKRRVEESRREIAEGEARIQSLREEQAGAEHRRQQILQRQRDLQSEIERNETRIRTNTDRITEVETSVTGTEREASEARVRLLDLQNTIESNRVTLDSARAKIGEQERHLDEAQGVYQRAEAAELAHDAVIHESQAALLKLEGTLANLRNQVATLEKQRQEFAVRHEKLQAERSVASEEHQKVAQRLDSLQTEIQSYKHTFEASRDAVGGGEDSVREAEHQCQVLGASIAEEQRLLSEKTSRRDVLRQLQESYEGYSEGAQALLRHSGEESPSSPILGTLANLIWVEPKYSAPIEAGLGLGLQSIVVSEFAGALQLVEQLRSRELGGALFAIREESPAGGSPLRFKREPLAGALAWASDVVKPQASVADFVGRLLADMVIVQDLHAAAHLRRENPGLTFVTMDGDVLDHHGILSAGSPRTSPLRLIGRRNEIATLDREISQLEARLHDLSARKGEWEGRRALTRQSLGDRQLELRAQENDLARREAVLSSMQTEARDFERRASSAGLEIQDIERLSRENEDETGRVRHELSVTDAEQIRMHEKLASERRRAEELASERNRCSVVVNDLRVAHATTRQQIQGLEAQAQPLEGQLVESRNFITAREAEVRASRQRIVQWRGENAEAAQQIEGLRQSASGIAGQIAEVESEKARHEAGIQAADEALRGLRQAIESIQDALTEHEVKLTGQRAALSHLGDRILREYGVDLAAVQLLPIQRDPTAKPAKAAPIVGDAPADAEGAESTSAPEPIQMTALNFGNWEEVAARVAEIRAKIQGMGPVNLDAVQEFEELEQRHSFLTREHDDLVQSREQLHAILRKINLTTRKMFAETFEKIRANFQQVFSELFGGGKADLHLMDENDPLECGIEIMAKPPGKQLQSITLLSGGERTMTAVSLMFAIYMVKPSPFCVLDEMDAPLDESNISRFVGMLNRFLAHSQFVVITHNKRTIGMADALYGVTMEERGVSKLVSVKFHKKGDTDTHRHQEGTGFENSEPSAAEDKPRSRLLVDAPPVEGATES